MRIKKPLFAMVLSAATLFAPTVFCETPELQPAEKPGWTLVFQEEFNDAVLNPSKFSDSYMPHWTSQEQSLAWRHFAINELEVYDRQ